MKITINMNKIKVILLFVMSALPGCCLLIGNIKLRLSLILTIGFLAIFLTYNYKQLLKEIIITFNNKMGKLLLVWLFWCFISGMVACISGNCKAAQFIYYFIFHGILLVCFPYYFAFDTVQKISIHKIIKYYFLFIMCIYALGILNYIFMNTNISFLQTFFFKYVANARNLLSDIPANMVSLKRVHSTFVEPSYFANFICLNLPLLYEFSKSKFKIFKSKILNLLSKKLLVILAWLLLISTRSPIFLVIGISLSAIYIIANHNIKRIFSVFNITVFTFLTIILITFAVIFHSDTNINVHETYLNRIINTISSINSFENFAQMENSLATRIVSSVNQFILGIHHPVFGVGYGNVAKLLQNQYMFSPLPLTYEILESMAAGKEQANLIIFWTTIAEIGFVGLTLFYFFLINVIQKAKILIKYTVGNTQSFFKSLYWGVCFFTVVSVYDGEFSTHILMIMGFISGYYSKLIRNSKQQKLNDQKISTVD